MPYKSKEDLYANQKKYRINIRAKMYKYLSDKSCLDCGEADPIVLDFDHIDPKEKTRSIAKFMSGHNSWESILLEIGKCEIRCANCHRRKSHKQFNYFGKTAPVVKWI